MSRKILVLMGLLSVVLCFAGGSTAWAMIPKLPTGDLCLNCHESATPIEGPPANWTLLPKFQGETGCIKCHSHGTSSTTYVINPGGSPEVTVPVTVFTGTTEPTEFLASGNFWWVKRAAHGDPNDPMTGWTGGGSDAGGHNIFPGEDDARYTLEGVSVAPGHSSGCLNPESCHSNLNTEDTTYGSRQSCLKCHMMMKGADYPAGFHHADDSAVVVGMGHYVPGDPGFDGYYRYLTGHMSGEGHGVAGIEDDDWEATVSPTDHNEYLGAQHALNSPGGFGLTEDRHTSTAYCSGCHGNFHVASEYPTGKAAPESPYEWLRHPVGMVLPDVEGSDFEKYVVYNPNVPLGRPDLAFFTEPSDAVDPGTDVINCLSCHRSHGTPGGSHLRWDPTAFDACATCHFSKKAAIPGQYICDEIDDCNDCHTSHGKSDRLPELVDAFGPSDNENLVWMKIDIMPGPVEDFRNCTFPIPGDSPYVRAMDPFDGICEICHTNAIYWKNDGTGATHYGGPGQEEQCLDCHLHTSEFLGEMPDDAPHHMHMDGTTHGPDEQECNDCHLAGTDNQLSAMVTAGTCDNCHSPGGGYNGVNDPNVGAANNWTTLVRQPDGTLTPGKERWCAGCHDSEPANSKADGSGVYAQMIAGDGSTWGFYVTGHGRSGIDHECVECHDASVDHIDGERRTYAFSDADASIPPDGPDMYDPGNSGVKYAAGYRLKYIDGQVPLMIPNNFRITFGYDRQQHEENAYRLCFSCHPASKVLDNTPMGDSLDTNFMASGAGRIPEEQYQEYPKKYSHVWGSGGDINDHVSHILNYIGVYWNSDWDDTTTAPDAAPGNDGCDSSIACSSCHNVHGSVGIEDSTNEAMIRNGKLVEREPGFAFRYLVEDPVGFPMVTSTGATREDSIGAVFGNDTGEMCIGCHGDDATVTTRSYDATGWGLGTYLEYYRRSKFGDFTP